MMKVLKLFSFVLASAAASLVLAAAIAKSMPDYSVEISTGTGKCKKVEYRGQIVPGGCQEVAAGKISRYEIVHGY